MHSIPATLTRITVYDLLGKVLFTSQFRESPARENLDFLAPGLYYLGIRNGNHNNFLEILKN